MTQLDPSETPTGPRLAGLAGDIGLAAAYALAALLYINMLGPNFTFDSNLYLIVAEQITQGNFSRYCEYAPLLPWMLGLLDFILRDMMLAINAYLFLAWVLLFYVLRVALRPGPLALVFVLVFLFSNAASANQFSVFLTELFYAFLLLIAVVSLGAPELFGRAQSRFWAQRETVFLVTLALLPMQRYVGGFMVLYLAALYLLMASDLSDVQRRLIRLAGAALPFSFILFWNYITTTHFGGYRLDVEHGAGENVGLIRDLLVQHFPFEAAVLLVSAFGLVAWILKQQKVWGRRRAGVLVLVVLIPFVQLAIQLLAASLFYTDAIAPRVVLVILPVVVVYALKAVALAAQWAVRFVPKLEPAFFQEAVWFVAILALIWLRAWPEPRGGLDLYDATTRPQLTQALARPGLNRIALVHGPIRGWFAAEVLTGRLTYDLPCRTYTIEGSNFSTLFQYVPECPGVSGPVLVPLLFEGWDHAIESFDAVLLRYFEDEYDVAMPVAETVPACATIEKLTENAYRRFVLYDLRGCRD